MNSPIRRLAMVLAALMGALLVASSWIQVIAAPGINDKPGNVRTLQATYGTDRGDILVASSAIARSTPTDDEWRYQRRYSQPELYANLTGYYSTTYGAGGGLEGSSNDLLSGRADSLFFGRLADTLRGRSPKGASLELTIDPKIQKAAWDALGNQRGSVVALDPKTGAILAMVSKPSYDPNKLATHDANKLADVWKQLNADPERPLINRAIAGDLYPPGSIFKVITAAAALESGSYSKDTVIPGPGVLDLPLTTATLPNDYRQPCGPGNKSSLLVAMAKSCNTSFGALGMKLGQDAVAEQAAKFGFGMELKIPMNVTPSVFPKDLNAPQLAQASIGQNSDLITPLQAAMMSAGIANKGVVMKPYLIKSVKGADTSTIETTTPEQFSTAVSPGTADQITEMMTAVVNSGTGKPAAINGVQVAGKTGTAEHGDPANKEAPHVWFTGFAPAANPTIAVAVVVEDGGTIGREAFGGTVAGPIAKQVIQAGMNR